MNYHLEESINLLRNIAKRKRISHEFTAHISTVHEE